LLTPKELSSDKNFVATRKKIQTRTKFCSIIRFIQQLTTSKKPAMKTSPQKENPQDWHRADIKAALEKAGWSLRQLAMAHGYVSGVMCHPLNGQYPKCERIIAEAIGVTPQTIWPSRYNLDGTPKKMPRRPRAPHIKIIKTVKPASDSTKFNTSSTQNNVELAVGN
jgi:Ner family transcriptional regulator